MTCDMWHVTCDMWHVTFDTWDHGTNTRLPVTLNLNEPCVIRDQLPRKNLHNTTNYILKLSSNVRLVVKYLKQENINTPQDQSGAGGDVPNRLQQILLGNGTGCRKNPVERRGSPCRPEHRTYPSSPGDASHEELQQTHPTWINNIRTNYTPTLANALKSTDMKTKHIKDMPPKLQTMYRVCLHRMHDNNKERWYILLSSSFILDFICRNT